MGDSDVLVPVVRRWSRNGVPADDIRDRLARCAPECDADVVLAEAGVDNDPTHTGDSVRRPKSKLTLKSRASTTIAATTTMPSKVKKGATKTIATTRTSKNSHPEEKNNSRWHPGEPLADGRWNYYHRDVFSSAAFRRLSRVGKFLLWSLFTQFDGFNNGRLQASLTWLQREFAWGSSPKSLAAAIQELRDAGFIIRTREATSKRPAWYQLTWIEAKAAQK